MKAGQGLVSYRLGVRVDFSDMVIERRKSISSKENCKGKGLEELGRPWREVKAIRWRW